MWCHWSLVWLVSRGLDVRGWRADMVSRVYFICSWHRRRRRVFTARKPSILLPDTVSSTRCLQDWRNLLGGTTTSRVSPLPVSFRILSTIIFNTIVQCEFDSDAASFSFVRFFFFFSSSSSFFPPSFLRDFKTYYRFRSYFFRSFLVYLQMDLSWEKGEWAGARDLHKQSAVCVAGGRILDFCSWSLHSRNVNFCIVLMNRSSYTYKSYG